MLNSEEHYIQSPGQEWPKAAQESSSVQNHAALIWSVADLLRGDYKRSEYGRVILPLTVLRCLDGVLAPTKDQVLERRGKRPDTLSNINPILNRITGVQFNNTSVMDLRRVLDDPANAADQLRQYVAGFSENVREVFEKFDLDTQIARLPQLVSHLHQRIALREGGPGDASGLFGDRTYGTGVQAHDVSGRVGLSSPSVCDGFDEFASSIESGAEPRNRSKSRFSETSLYPSTEP